MGIADHDMPVNVQSVARDLAGAGDGDIAANQLLRQVCGAARECGRVVSAAGVVTQAALAAAGTHTSGGHAGGPE